MANMFDRLAGVADSRKLEQEALELKLVGEMALSERERIVRGRPRKRKDVTTLTITIDRAAKEKVKLYAYENSISVADLIHRWIHEHCDSK